MTAAPWRCRSARGRWSACGTPSRMRRCVWRFPDRRHRPDGNRVQIAQQRRASAGAFPAATPSGFERNSTGSPWTPELHALVDRWEEIRFPSRICRHRAGFGRRAARRIRAGRCSRCRCHRSARSPGSAGLASGWPVFMKICAGAWLNCVVCMRSDNRDVVHDVRQVRQQTGNLRAAVSITGKADAANQAASAYP